MGELQQYLWHIYLEQAEQMVRDRELVNFTLDMVDKEKLSAAIHRTVNLYLECGIFWWEAIQAYIKVDIIKASQAGCRGYSFSPLTKSALNKKCLKYFVYRTMLFLSVYLYLCTCPLLRLTLEFGLDTSFPARILPIDI